MPPRASTAKKTGKDAAGPKDLAARTPDPASCGESRHGVGSGPRGTQSQCSASYGMTNALPIQFCGQPVRLFLPQGMQPVLTFPLIAHFHWLGASFERSHMRKEE